MICIVFTSRKRLSHALNKASVPGAAKMVHANPAQ